MDLHDSKAFTRRDFLHSSLVLASAARIPEAARRNPGRPMRSAPDAEATTSQAIPNKTKRIAGRIRDVRLFVRQTDDTAHTRRGAAYQAQDSASRCSP